jgi:hypothetical protein
VGCCSSDHPSVELTLGAWVTAVPYVRAPNSSTVACDGGSHGGGLLGNGRVVVPDGTCDDWPGAWEGVIVVT